MSSPLARLAPEARRKLIEALESERVPKFEAVAIGRYVGPRAAADIAPELQRLAEVGLTPRLLAEMLRMLESERDDERPSLVWTGPDDERAQMRDTGVVVRELFERAERHVLVAGFAVHQGRRVFDALAKRMETFPKLDVDMYLNVERKYRDTTASDQILAAFGHRLRKEIWNGPRLPSIYYDVRALELDGKKKQRACLHAKCVVVDGEHVFVTSANFTEAAQQRNIEVGLLVRDESIAKQLSDQFRGLVERGDLRRLPGC